MSVPMWKRYIERWEVGGAACLRVKGRASAGGVNGPADRTVEKVEGGAHLPYHTKRTEYILVPGLPAAHGALGGVAP